MEKFKDKMNPGQKRLLIIGCGRSGTLYSAEVFRTLGLDILHERHHHSQDNTGSDGFASWFLTVDDPHPPFGPSSTGFEFEHILHQVRHPLPVIASFAQHILQKGIKSPDFLEKYIPEMRYGTDYPELTMKQRLIWQAAIYWYEWNLLSEKKASETVQLENLDQELPRICDQLHISFDTGAVALISKKTNERRIYIDEEPWIVSWEDLREIDPALTEKIKELAIIYGYHI